MTMPSQGSPSLAARLIRLLSGLTFLAWLGKLLVLYFSPDYAPAGDPPSRLYLSARESLHTLPETIGEGADWLTVGLKSVAGSYAAQLGGGAQPSAAAPGELVDALIYALGIFALLTSLQLAALVLLMARGARIGWPFPGVPVILSARAKLAYWLLVGSGAIGLAGFSLSEAPLAALAAILALLAGLRYPASAALPLWVICQVMRLCQPAQLGKSTSSVTEPNTPVPSGRQLSPAPSAPPPSRGRAAPTYAQACETLDLTPGSFPPSTAHRHYRRAMAALTPDMIAEQRRINEALETILAYHDWTS